MKTEIETVCHLAKIQTIKEDCKEPHCRVLLYTFRDSTFKTCLIPEDWQKEHNYNHHHQSLSWKQLKLDDFFVPSLGISRKAPFLDENIRSTQPVELCPGWSWEHTVGNIWDREDMFLFVCWRLLYHKPSFAYSLWGAILTMIVAVPNNKILMSAMQAWDPMHAQLQGAIFKRKKKT